VRLNGRIFEAVVARLEKRPSKDLYHSALVVRAPEGEFVIEQAPVGDGAGVTRGVVAEGAVGSRWARSLRIFRYEIRRWRDGVIPDVGEAVDSPQRLTDDPFIAQRVLELVPDVPTPVWGRDELHAGEMWNSNSAISWLMCAAASGSRRYIRQLVDELLVGVLALSWRDARRRHENRSDATGCPRRWPGARRKRSRRSSVPMQRRSTLGRACVAR
jgi:hypothetical protein